MNQPFLPEPETPAAPATAPKKSQGWKTLVLWLVLIVMFLTIWQFLSPDPSKHPSPPPLPSCEPASSPVFTAVPWVLLAALVVLVFYVIRKFKANTEFNVSQEPGRVAVAERRFGDAVEVFRATLPRNAKLAIYRAANYLNLADAQLHAGQLEAALASCAEIERGGQLMFGSGLRTRVATMTALLYGLRGDVPTAERWATDARARIAKNREDRLAYAAQLCVAEAVIMMRRGDASGAITQLERRWNELRYSMTADTMRSVEVLRAFAEAQTGVRTSNTVAERLVRVEPVTPHELAYLGAEWPEMQAFLAAHGLG